MRLVLLTAAIAVALVFLISSGRRNDASPPHPDVARAELASTGGMVDPVAEAPPVIATNATSSSVDPPTSHPGYAVYKKRGCSVCHGRDLEGTRMGPTLANAAKNFDRDELRRFLSNPDSAAAVTPRLSKLEEKFSMFVMPSFTLPPSELKSLSDLLLRARN